MPETSSIDYERVVYPNFIHAQTHPNRLATMARAYGLKSAPVENCRVLEVGCGSGMNLLAMACGLPESEFVGIDLSNNHISFGTRAASEIGVENLRLICADLLQVDSTDFGKFDYIIAHGFYSWIPPIVREKFLEICRAHLAPEGVAFVSYNALPGCHLRLMMREMMTFHTEAIESPFEKAEASVKLLKTLGEAAFERDIYGRILQYETEKIVKRGGEVMIHDDLGTFNQPFYFHEFINAAEQFDLQFLSEAEYFFERYQHSSKEAVGLLSQFDGDIIRREQYNDFLKNRRFRQTLLCHKNVNLQRTVAADFFDEMQIVCDLQPESKQPDFTARKVEKFSKSAKKGFSIDHPLTKAALFHLCRIFPRSISFDELAPAAENLLKKQFGGDYETPEKERAVLKDILLEIFGSELVDFFVYEPPIADAVSEKPQADRLVRWQAKNAETLFTGRLRSKTVEDPFIRNLLAVSDGDHTLADIVEDFKKKISDGRLPVKADKLGKQKLIKNLPEVIEHQLRQAAKLALLVS